MTKRKQQPSDDEFAQQRRHTQELHARFELQFQALQKAADACGAPRLASDMSPYQMVIAAAFIALKTAQQR